MNTAPIRSLEARYYTDPDIFAKEQAGLLSRSWQFAGHLSQIPNIGDYFAFQIMGQNLFSIRGQDGVVRSFYNVCQHRAHELLSGSGNKRMVVCPYHAWSYELTGKLRGGPNLNSVPGFNREEICLTPVRCEDFHGFLFVNLDDDAAPMDEWFPGVRAELADFVPQIHSLKPLEWVEVREKCNWKVSVENYSECYHCPKNHRTFSEGIIKPETYNIQPDRNGGYVLRHTTQCQPAEKMTYPVDLSIRHAGDYQSWFLWPMFSFQCYPGNILNSYHWRAHDAESCTVWRGWYAGDGQDGNLISELAVQDLQTTVAEDIKLVESVQRGLKSRGYAPGPLVIDPACGVLSEHSLAKLQQWMRAAAEN